MVRTSGPVPRALALAVLLCLGLLVLPAASAGPATAAPGQVRAYFFGDSLMSGTGVLPRRPVMARIAAARLGWHVDVDAWGGTGYTTTGSSPSYLSRLRRPGAMTGTYDVVLLEGGTNDARVGSSPTALRRAVLDVLAEVRRRQPQARIVLMGAYDPPPPGRLDPRRTVVDQTLATLARQQGLAFFSPVSGGWTSGAGPSFLSSDALHPSMDGYVEMGLQLAASLTQATRCVSC